MTSTEFFADMDADCSDMESLYETCGALIDEGWTQSDSEDDGADGINFDAPSTQISLPHTISPPSTPAVDTSAVERSAECHPVTGLPIPPFMRNHPTQPIPDRRDVAVDISPEGYNHLDPTRPNPYIYFYCGWERCLERIKGASPGPIQCHLKRMHQVDKSVNHLVRCEEPASCEDDSICGHQIPASELGMHVCDVHWRSRVVRCPFCGIFQTHRDDVLQHWIKSCSEFATASEEERKAWRGYWRWPAKNWLRESS